MKRTILTCIITLCWATGTFLPVHSATYRLEAVDATTSGGYFNTSDQYHTKPTIQRISGKGATISTPTASFIKNRDVAQNLEWITLTNNAPIDNPSCRSATVKPVQTGYIYGDTTSTIVNNQDFPYNSGSRDEPYSGAANAKQSKMTYFVPETIECSGEGPSVTMTRTLGFHQQKWWDGNTPNLRSQILNVNLVYLRDASITARFVPDTLDLRGSAGQYVTGSTKLEITTDPGSQITVDWPEISRLEYLYNGMWVRGHTSIVINADGLAVVDKQLRVYGTTAGSETISVPVSVSIT